MFRNYVSTAWRHLINNRLFSLINILGLSIGLMSCILIMLYVNDETGYDRWIPGSDRIVRMHSAFYAPERPPFLTVRSAGRMMDAITQLAPEQVAEGVRILQVGATVREGDKTFAETALFADSSFFEVFDLPFVRGDALSSFSQPLHTILSEKTAIRFFGTTDVVGRSLTLCCLEGKPVEVAVSGVIRDLPENTHFDIELLLYLDPPMFDFAPNLLNTWTSVNTYTYFKLQPTASADTLKERVDHWLDTESPLVAHLGDMGGKVTDIVQLSFMPLTDLHLRARSAAGNMGDFKPLGDLKLVYAFSGIAALVLLIASINFMNLSTARATVRAREVALRKVMGATRQQITIQFLGEAVALTLVSLLFALVAVEAVLPFYNEVIGKNLSLVFTEQPGMLALALLTAIIVGLLAGSYPAVYLSRFMPSRIMKANQAGEAGGQGRLRSALVVFQFSISIGLAVCTLVIYGQTLFARSMDLGYDYESKLALSGLRGLGDQQTALIQELENISGVSGVALSSEVPSQDNENNTGFKRLDAGAAGNLQQEVILNYYTVGYDFFELYDMDLVAGRTFDENRGTDEIVAIDAKTKEIGTAGLIINESAARRLGYPTPEDAVGGLLRADVFQAGTHDLTIIGVSRDVYFRSIKFDIRPSVFMNFGPRLRVATIAFEGDHRTVKKAVENVWRDLAPDTPIRLSELKTMVNDQYRTEERQAWLFSAFSVLAIVIACLGLFGLASFTAERRTREIGIRRVLGARIRDIISLLVWQFSVPVLLANLIAWPVAWFAMTRWLEGFSYRIGEQYILIASLTAGVGALMIAWLTVMVRAIKVARASPINSLRYE
jgi:putative ABC transport system permease protein